MQHHRVILSSEDEEGIYKALMKQVQTSILTTPAIRLVHATRQEGYRLYEQHHGVRVYTRKSASGGEETMSVSYSQNHLTFENLVYLLLAPSTEEHRIQQTLFHDDAFLDGCVLSTVLSPTDEDPFQWYGLKYTKMALSSYRFVDPRDLCYVEISGTTINMEGNTVLYVMRESMTLNSVPLVPDAIRGRVKSLSLHTECPNGTIEHVHFSYLNPFGSVPAFLFKPTQLRMNTLVERYAELIHFKRMLELSKHCTTFFPHSQKACGSCDRSFWALMTRYYCRSCGEVICGNCAIFIPRPKEQLFQTHLSVVKEEYCKTCYLHVRGPTSSSMTSSSSIGGTCSFQQSDGRHGRPDVGGATFMLSSRHFPKDSETTYQSNRSLLSMPTSRRGYKTPSTKQATLSMIPPLRG
ncbi:hypothetical protein, variant 2 [Aphanomyces astaci]|uniref:FYVE-type domain-containing protein n=1 Tax=Aphanomyces astaci TaxID=112090 RepID=W4GAT5_APHAT|nr:hypothetical protein, variant 2 [Aphanomyces astaci]ETV76164.1 hypothetical protein, variant 2 [Aphanomyces astaci]|eukprot:XP_009834288.1 hypothetical protein, variant 2 [Aphanomyces astaci]